MMPPILSMGAALFTIIASAIISLDAFSEYYSREKTYQIIFTIAATVTAFSSIMYVIQMRRKMSNVKPKQIFISYARSDAGKAKEIAKLLRDNNFKPWLDVDHIAAGQIYSKIIEDGIRESEAAVVLISKHFTESRSAQKELRIILSAARSSRKSWTSIIPIRLEDADVPEELQHIQWVDYHKPSGEETLLRGLRGITGGS